RVFGGASRSPRRAGWLDSLALPIRSVTMANNNLPGIAVGLGILLGLVAGAVVLGRSLEQMRVAERYVTVRGVAERDVTSDLSIWPIKVRVAGENLANASQS